MDEARKFEIGTELETPVKQHKFNGLDEEKRIKSLPNNEQAEYHAYRCDNGNIGFPSSWFYGAMVEAFIRRAGSKKKTEEQNRVAPRMRIFPPMIDTKVKDYRVDVVSAPAGNVSRGGVRDFVVKPLIPTGTKASFVLTTTLPESDEEIKKMLSFTGDDVGVGSDRKHGYGRFKIIEFKKVE